MVYKAGASQTHAAAAAALAVPCALRADGLPQPDLEKTLPGPPVTNSRHWMVSIAIEAVVNQLLQTSEHLYYNAV